jgi:hypothetical protein
MIVFLIIDVNKKKMYFSVVAVDEDVELFVPRLTVPPPRPPLPPPNTTTNINISSHYLLFIIE